jgi:hypothetical protein
VLLLVRALMALVGVSEEEAIDQRLLLRDTLVEALPPLTVLRAGRRRNGVVHVGLSRAGEK